MWLGDSRSNVKSFSATVQDEIGYALYVAHLGDLSTKAKPLHGLSGGVMEIAKDGSETCRAVYTILIGDAIYVIHPRPGSQHRSSTRKWSVNV